MTEELKRCELPDTSKIENLETKKVLSDSETFGRVLNSVVKVFSTSSQANFSIPWQFKRQITQTSSGFVIETKNGKRIIGNAHGVANSTSIRVKKNGDSKKYTASIAFISHEADICMLQVENEDFWNGILSLNLKLDLPKLHESVTIVGFPQGGENVSATSGVISRIDVNDYCHSGESLLSIQTDSAINVGNSGCPAVQGDCCVGIAFEVLTDAQNIGYLIPVSILKHFLDDVERNSNYTGFPRVGINWLKLENQAMKKFYKVPPDQSGIVINSVEPMDLCADVLTRGDVITRIENIPVADDGTVSWRETERVLFRHIESSKFVGEELKLDIIREGKQMEVAVKLNTRKTYQLVPFHSHDEIPKYFVFGGLVFTVLTRNYLLHSYGIQWSSRAPINLIYQTYYGKKLYPDHEIVILAQVLDDEVNTGYREYENASVCIIDGVPIRSLQHLINIIESSEKTNQEFIVLEFNERSQLVLELKKFREVQVKILNLNNIPSEKSKNLK